MLELKRLQENRSRPKPIKRASYQMSSESTRHDVYDHYHHNPPPPKKKRRVPGVDAEVDVSLDKGAAIAEETLKQEEPAAQRQREESPENSYLAQQLNKEKPEIRRTPYVEKKLDTT